MCEVKYSSNTFRGENCIYIYSYEDEIPYFDSRIIFMKNIPIHDYRFKTN